MRVASILSPRAVLIGDGGRDRASPTNFTGVGIEQDEYVMLVAMKIKKSLPTSTTNSTFLDRSGTLQLLPRGTLGGNDPYSILRLSPAKGSDPRIQNPNHIAVQRNAALFPTCQILLGSAQCAFQFPLRPSLTPK
ncbi:hypothetical protein CLCR_09261 [Cladophialophora carrionii]|uniref:Uncharacterized protein n=1 Tax=Cladophialophora carrionii TaxID=86049 RepID=A0A1C1CRX0_9EURO|nr:hypothetical protein CLCR_09261 [Cladophialophora carrionii]